METEIEKQNQKPSASKKIRKAVALGVMFTLGVSAFAHGKGEGKIYERNAWKTSAIDDMCAILDYSAEILKDGIITEAEKSKLQSMSAEYNTDYGKGATEFVIRASNEYSKTPAGASLASKGKDGMTAIIQKSVRRAAETQKSMNTLSSGEKKMTLADYEGFSR